MELTKFCVELVWMLCFCVELIWILNFGFILTFGLILGLIVGWFYVVFLACFVSCLWHVLWPIREKQVYNILISWPRLGHYSAFGPL